MTGGNIGFYWSIALFIAFSLLVVVGVAQFQQKYKDNTGAVIGLVIGIVVVYMLFTWGILKK